MPWRNLSDDPALHDFLGDLFACPMTDGTLRGCFTGQRDDLTPLFCGDLCWCSRTWNILKPFADRKFRKRDSLKTDPPSAPGTNHVETDRKVSGSLCIPFFLCCCQHDFSSFRQLLRSALPMDQGFSPFSFFLA